MPQATEWIINTGRYEGWADSHERWAGIFKLYVWPLKASEKHPFTAWAIIPNRGNDTQVMPVPPNQKIFTSLEEAKKWIEDAVRKVCQQSIHALCEYRPPCVRFVVPAPAIVKGKEDDPQHTTADRRGVRPVDVRPSLRRPDA